MSKPIRKVCVYCASSRQADPAYADAAYQLGRLLAAREIGLIYGGGSVGSMGALAEGALSMGGQVIGVLPQFMYDLEWGHLGLTELRLVNDLHERKRLMLEDVDALVALPGGSGTLEELLEAITWKRLGLYLNPIVLVNIRQYFDPLVAMLEQAIAERFMDARHQRMWQVVGRVEEVISAIEDAPPWTSDARGFATL
ncbi:MAG: lysine decarboxylase [Candidatus Entotheonella factor]|uniref:Cytokinin riboside 5'-monophosphate phosphoribohydrolase n=1 Tax=Entotheonella factor TaxID=1429438 RepID=W4LFF7_ENTF1|nr:MAG: lysine decarboxylase [Candidatus Entotheonella factor]